MPLSALSVSQIEWRTGPTVTDMKRKAEAWVVAARLSDGSGLYFSPPGSRVGGQDEWSPRVNQAVRFDSKAEAEQVAARFDVNGVVKEYLVVKL